MRKYSYKRRRPSSSDGNAKPDKPVRIISPVRENTEVVFGPGRPHVVRRKKLPVPDNTPKTQYTFKKQQMKMRKPQFR